MKTKIIYAIAVMLIATGCKKGMGDMMMMGSCKNDHAMCRSMCATMLDNATQLQMMKDQGVYVEDHKTGEIDREATLNKMMEMCTKNTEMCPEMCGKMMNKCQMTGMMHRWI